MRALPVSLAASALALWAALALAQDAPVANPFAGDADAIAAGKAIYDTTCAGCHGGSGVGGNGTPLNRPLTRAGGDADLFRLIREGVADTAMPAFPALSDDSTWRIIAYVRSLDATAPTPLSTASAQAGASLFFGRGGCTACHEVDGLGKDLAADLSSVGLKPATDIRNALKHEPLGLRFVTVTRVKGERLSGILRGEDLFTLQLKQADGKLVMLRKADIRSVTDATNPLLPLPLNDAETDDMVAYLSQRKARNLAETAKLIPRPVLAYSRIATPDYRNWVTHRGGLDGGNFSTLSGINAAAATRLQARWSAGLGDGVSAATPLVVDGIIYVTGAGGNVYAFDAASGLPVWRFEREPVLDNPVPVGGNRGVALLDGRVFTGTADNKLIALDANSGRQLWEKQSASTLDGYALTGAPLALRTRIITGVGGAGTKARGWLEAVDPATGKALWHFDTTPANAAGGMTAVMGAYEAQNVTLYWSTTRASDDSATGDAILALNANTGEVRWTHKLQAGAGGNHVVLADQGKRALLLHLGRDGLFTVLDRTTGKSMLSQSLTRERVETPALSFDRSSAIAYAGLSKAAAAMDTRTGKTLWRMTLPAEVRGILATRGGIVLATLADGQAVVLGAKDGKLLWSFRAAGAIAGSPVSYTVNGKQFITFTAGNTLYAFALPG
jgi:outer membrane protein assembly factor BamB/mono/diheme cytochrome c family protein